MYVGQMRGAHIFRARRIAPKPRTATSPPPRPTAPAPPPAPPHMRRETPGRPACAASPAPRNLRPRGGNGVIPRFAQRPQERGAAGGGCFCGHDIPLRVVVGAWGLGRFWGCRTAKIDAAQTGLSCGVKSKQLIERPAPTTPEDQRQEKPGPAQMRRPCIGIDEDLDDRGHAKQRECGGASEKT